MSTKVKEYFLDTTGKRDMFIKKCSAYVIWIDFKISDYQYAKRLCAGYNYINEEKKLLIAKEDNTLYVIEHTIEKINDGLNNGSIVFDIG